MANFLSQYVLGGAGGHLKLGEREAYSERKFSIGTTVFELRGLSSDSSVARQKRSEDIANGYRLSPCRFQKISLAHLIPVSFSPHATAFQPYSRLSSSSSLIPALFQSQFFLVPHSKLIPVSVLPHPSLQPHSSHRSSYCSLIPT